MPYLVLCMFIEEIEIHCNISKNVVCEHIGSSLFSHKMKIVTRLLLFYQTIEPQFTNSQATKEVVK